MTTQILTQNRLKELLSYNPDTGIFTWRHPTSNRVKVGDVCSCKDVKGYLVIRLFNKQYKAHQLAWLYTHGCFVKELDHINRQPGDNRMANLRVATRSEQMHNAGMLKNNISGVKGVCWHKASGKWHVRIWFNGKCNSFGYFDCLESAKKERDARTKIFSARRNGFNEPSLVART